MEYFEDYLNKASIFLDESKLDPNYIPEKLPHREKELSLLSQLFIGLILNPNSISRKILITGNTGIGKTATIKLMGLSLIKIAKKRDIGIKYVHVNCRKERTSYKVLINIISSLIDDFPKRGYSPQDLLEIIIEILNKKNLHLLLILDELKYLIRKEEDLIYSLTRAGDDLINSPQRISIIGIVRNISCLNNLDSSTLSTLQKNIIKFNNYSLNQIFDILKYRANLSFANGAVPDKIISMIANIVLKNGDIRHGLNILWKAGKIAETMNLKIINSECVRLANQDLIPFSTQDIIKFMNIHELLLILAIIRCLKKNFHNSEISFLEIQELYAIMCENLQKKSRSNSQLWNYLQNFKKENLITIRIQSKDIKGRKSFISIPNISLSKFESIIINELKARGICL